MTRTLVVLCLLSALAMLGSGTASAQQPGDTVRLFIQLPDRPRADDSAAVNNLGGRTRHLFAESNTISIEIPAVFAPYLAHYSRFIEIRPVPRVKLLEDQLDWGVDAVEADKVWGGVEDAVNVDSSRPNGSGVSVAVIDTGAGPHPDLNIFQWVNCIPATNGAMSGCVTGQGFDDHGHGTHVAGTVAALDNDFGMVGVAPKATLYSIKVLDASGSGWMDDVAAAINWAAGANIDVAQMSVGCYTTPISNCNDPVVANAVANAYNGGMVLIAAAGNNGDASCATTGSQVNYPALYGEVIAVAAVNSSNVRPCWSSVGIDVELSAPGVSIRSTVPTSCPGLSGTNCSTAYASISGTSMATPHVSGVAALIIDCNPGLNPAQVKSMLTSNVIDLGAAGKDNLYGYGLVQADDAVAAAGCAGGVTPAPDFNVSCNPSSLTVVQGESGASTCTVSSSGGFNGAVTLDCTSLQANVSCSFGTNPVTPAADGSVASALTLNVDAAVPVGSDGFQVSGTNASTTRSANLTLNVSAPPDVTTPSVTTKTPLDGATGVALNTQIKAAFSEPMLASSITTTTFKVQAGSATPVAGSRSYNAGTNTYTLTPTGPLLANTLYTVTLSTGIKDLANISLPATTWTFRTATAPVNTGFRNCTASNAVTSGAGDNNGFQTSASGACADGGTYARDDNSGRTTALSCTDAGKDRHIFSNYGVAIPAGATINGIEVRLDAWADSSSSSPRMCVQVSTDGVNWSTPRSTTNLSSSQRTYSFGSATDLWGASTISTTQAAGLRIRVTPIATSTSRDFRLDWVTLRVTYTPAPTP